MSRSQEQGASISITRRVFSLPTVISLAVAGAFLVFLFTRFDVGLAATWQQLKAANPLYLSLALAVHYTTFLFRGLRWRLLLNNVRETGESEAGIFQCARLVLLGWFANSVAWLRLGDAYRSYLYHEESRAPFARTIGTLLSERLLDIATVAALLALSLPFLVGTNRGGVLTVTVTAGALLGALTLALLAVSAIGAGRNSLTGRLRSWLPQGATDWLSERYRQFRYGALLSLKQTPLAVGWGLLSWFAEIGRLYLVTQALDLHLSPFLIIFITLSNSLLTLVPTPGGLGAVEAGLVGLLKQLSTLTTPGAVALVAVDRSISYLSVIAAGAALFLGRWIFRRRRAALPVRPVAGAAGEKETG